MGYRARLKQTIGGLNVDIKKLVQNLELIESVIPNYSASRQLGISDEDSELIVNRALTLAIEFIEEQIPKDEPSIEVVANQRINNVIKVYTDGSCKCNPGKGGWAAIIVDGEYEAVVSGCHHCTTNNRMELQGVIGGLKEVMISSKVEVYTDSAYVVNCFNKGWRASWEEKDWITSANKQVKNSDLWKELFALVDFHISVKFIKVKGHSGHSYNERVDRIASTRAKGA